jgi:hypothetical protein
MSGQVNVGKKYYCAIFLKQMPNFNLLSTVTSDIKGDIFALFNPVFVPYIRFITVYKHRYNRYTLLGNAVNNCKPDQYNPKLLYHWLVKNK